MAIFFASQIHNGKNFIGAGYIATDNNGLILSLSTFLPKAYNPTEVQKMDGIICPGFVNTHCHLELSHLDGALPIGEGLVNFIKKIPKYRNTYAAETIAAAALIQDELMYQNGIVAVADISNGADSFETKKHSKIYYHTLVEALGIVPLAAQSIIEKAKATLALAPNVASIVPHAPYSVSENLFLEIKNTQPKLTSLHHQECMAEAAFYETKTGDFLDLYDAFEIDISSFTPKGINSSRTVLPLLSKDTNTLLVHNTYTQAADIDFAMALNANTYWCLCPNANLYIENTLPNVLLFIEKNCKITLGTDSLASNHTLSIWSEIQTLQRHFPNISLETMLTWATYNGADYMGIADIYGQIAVGMAPGLVHISMENEVHKIA